MKKSTWIPGLPRIISQATICFSLVTQLCFGQGHQTQAWTTVPFDDKEIIENKGQFPSTYAGGTVPILYAINQGGVSLYFTAEGLTWRHDDIKMDEENESGARKRKREEEELDITTRFMHMRWENPNPGVKVVAEDAFSYYRTYGDLGNPHQHTFVAGVYKKIIYKDLYPNIDVEYFFPANGPGIKYNVIVHPGADISLFQMKYSKTKNLSIDAQGNVVVASAFGPVTDHAPVSYTRDGRSVPSSFSLKGNAVSFQLPALAGSDVIIDPWVTNPVFTSINKAYDVDYDKNGNVFAYGGVNSWSPVSSFELVKIDAAGAIKWKYSTNLFSDQAPSPGDFFVDYNTGRSYIFEGENLGPPFNSGNNNSAEAIKLDVNGILVKFYIPATPVQSMTEFSRVAYNCATKTVIAAGGGVAGCWQAATFDTSFNMVSYKNVLASQGVTNAWNNSYHDIALLATDNAGDCYMLANRSFVVDPLHADNYLFKAPMTAPQNNTWGVSSKHHFIEEGNGIPKKYGMSASNIYLQNGYNGMAVNCNFLCTYDGHIMKKWDKSNGAFIKQITFSPDSLKFGGMDISHCDHIFAAKYNKIQILDANLNAVSSLSAQDTVYDLKLDEYRNVVYAVGRGFVSAIAINENCMENVFITSTNGNCTLASATVQDTGITACISESQFSYSWSNGSTAQTISNLTTGTYSVIVTHDFMISCHPFSRTDTATVSVVTSGGIAATSSHLNTTCANSSGSAAVNITSGNPPYTYNWAPTGGTTASATGLTAGNYTVIITDASGCTKSDTLMIASTGSITAIANSVTVCVGQNALLAASGGTNYSWNTGATTSSITPVTTAYASYTVIVSSGSCIDTAYASLTVNPSPSVALGNDVTLCDGQSVTLDAGPNPGAGFFWNTGDTSQTMTVSGAGTYWVIIGLNSCFAKDTVSTFLAPHVQLTDTSLCTISPVVLDPGAGATNYLWSNGSNSQTISVDHSGTYWVVAVFGNCLSSDSATVTGDGTGGTLYIPNAFTPNGDFLNETFAAQGTGIATFNMRVFDRWGNLLFESDDINKGWDGKIDGGHYTFKKDGDDVSQEDVYVCKIDYSSQCFPKQVHNQIGIVSIVK